MLRSALVILFMLLFGGVGIAQLRQDLDHVTMEKRLLSGEVESVKKARMLYAYYDSDKEKFLPYARQLDSLRWSNYKNKQFYLQIFRGTSKDILYYPMPDAVRKSDELIMETVSVDLEKGVVQSHLDESDSLRQIEYFDSLAVIQVPHYLFFAEGVKDKLVEYNCKFEGKNYKFYSIHSWLCHDPFCGEKHGHANFEFIAFFSPDLGMIFSGYYGARFPDEKLPYEVMMYILNECNLHESQLEFYKKHLKKQWNSFEVIGN